VLVRTHGDVPDVQTGGDTARAEASDAPIARESGFATAADGTRIFYEKLGRGPAIVFIHGLGGNAAVWYKQVPRFARDHTVVVLSQRGFAPSEGTRDRFDVAQLADDFIRVLDDAGIERAHVVGQSMGGWTALRVAIAHPERVSSVVLADTIGGIFDDEIRAHYDTTVARARELGARTPPLGVHPALDPQYSREHPDEAYLYQLLATFGSPAPGLIAAQLGAAAVAPRELQPLELPVLFVVGERDPIFPPAIIVKAAAYVPKAKIATIAAAGHSPYVEQPDEWARVVRAFVSR
jgi:pimeloyl-ACP methyl ester carboxylesterase